MQDEVPIKDAAQECAHSGTRRERAIIHLWEIMFGIAGIFLPLLYLVRVWRGKEDATRRGERFARHLRPRPQGALIWIHAVSIGEFMAALPLIMALRAQERKASPQILVTTNTTSSAAIAAMRLPKDVIHQYWPWPTPSINRRFVDHWRPDLAVVVESEIWPVTLLALARRAIPFNIVNGGMSVRSYQRWRALGPFARPVFRRIARCAAKSDADASRFVGLGTCIVTVFANLKYDSPDALPDRQELASLRAALKARRCWLAASTHDGEEALAAQLHTRLRARYPDLVTLIVPRHEARGSTLAARLERQGLKVARRAAGDALTEDIDIYLADTNGEMSLFYALAPIVLVGGSICARGGHNPLEPARSDCALLCGPRFGGLADIYHAFVEASAIACCAGFAQLNQCLELYLGDEMARRSAAHRARKVAHQGCGSSAILARDMIARVCRHVPDRL